MLLLAFWIAIAIGMSTLVAPIIEAILNRSSLSNLISELMEGIYVSGLLGIALYSIISLFMVLAFQSSFYGDRLAQILRLPQESFARHDLLPVQRYEILDSRVTIDPTTKPVDVEDIAQCWRFYLGKESSTVTIEFRKDGTFTQTITLDQS